MIKISVILSIKILLISYIRSSSQIGQDSVIMDNVFKDTTPTNQSMKNIVCTHTSTTLPHRSYYLTQLELTHDSLNGNDYLVPGPLYVEFDELYPVVETQTNMSFPTVIYYNKTTYDFVSFSQYVRHQSSHGVPRTISHTHKDGAIEISIQYTIQSNNGVPEFSQLTVVPIHLDGETVSDFNCYVLNTSEEIAWFNTQETQLMQDVNTNSDKYRLRVDTQEDRLLANSSKN